MTDEDGKHHAQPAMERWCSVKLVAVRAGALRHRSAKPACEQNVDSAIPCEDGEGDANYECDFTPLPCKREWSIHLNNGWRGCKLRNV